MAPNPIESTGEGMTGEEMTEEMTGEEIVISGISGHFPSSENIEVLINNLYNKADMVTKLESKIKHPELSPYGGKIKDCEKFDSQFFRFTHWQAASFDAIGRKNMEQAYSAIFDAGINPETLKGKKLGVFIGSAQSDTATLGLYDVFNSNGFIISGCSKSMLANRISYWIDGKGPSYGLEYSCGSSMACLQLAIDRIKAGDCDCALVGGCSQIVHPVLTINMRRAGMVCLDGKTKCFDKNGDGFVRSDAINTMFIQKAKDAKRIYSQIYHIKGKHFSNPDSMFLPSRSSVDIEKFLKEFYSETDVSPKCVEYIEANAVGIAMADEEELRAIGNIFGKTNPVKVGSIKSNMGHTEAASGICSLTKICLSYQHGEIPANLHYNEPQDQVDAVKEKRIQVVTDNTKFNRGFTAINNFGYTGANYHVLLKGRYKQKDLSKYKCSIPHLVLASGRLDKSVKKIFDALENIPIDPEQLALLNNIFKYNTPGHTGRGYNVIDTIEEKTTSLARGFEVYDGNTRPIWFLFSGMGSQWPTMGAQLMRIPIFAASIEKCNEVLKDKGVDVIKIITEDNKEVFDNILNCFVGIIAIEIALTDVLNSIGIKPDNIIGHSAGEIGCAYADGSLNYKEAILLAYVRGKVSLEVSSIKGKMAAVGLGHKELRKICPAEIDIACENSPESATISGPADDIEKFVKYLTERSIFARTVASSGIAYHSRYIADFGPSMLLKMKDIIKTPKARSKSWLSTCFSPDQWSDETSLFASAEYFTHNILSPVHFEETAKLIPKNAIIIEVSPHGLMQAIMKRSHKSCMNLSLTRRGEKDNVKLLLQTIGTLYQAGLNPNVESLYPKVNFPVSTETSSLSHLVDWDHSEAWDVKDFFETRKNMTYSFEFVMSIHDDDYSMYRGCVRNGKFVFPEAAILVAIWKTLAMNKEAKYEDTSVEFKDVKFYKELIIQPEDTLKLLVQVQKGSSFFEVTRNASIISTGFINVFNKGKEMIDNKIHFNESEEHLNEKDIYNLLSLKGYNYEGQFKSIKHTNFESTKGLIKWENNWVTFLDSLIQLNAITKQFDGVPKLKLITRLVIDVEAHETGNKIKSDKDVCYGAQVFYDSAVTKSGGVLLTSVVFDDIPKVADTTENLIQIKQFFPHKPKFDVDLQTAMQVNLQMISQKINGPIALQYKDNKIFWNIPSVVAEITKRIPTIDIEVNSVIDSEQTTKTNETEPNVLLLYCSEDNKIEQNITNTDVPMFVIALMQERSIIVPKQFTVATKFKFGNLILVLLELNSESLSTKRGGDYYIPATSKANFANANDKEVFDGINKVTLMKDINNENNELVWAQVPTAPNNNTIQVLYTGVHLNDAHISAEIGENLNKHGIGFSGVNSRGERVMGIIPDGTVTNIIEPNYDFLWPVPKHWNLEEAATVPLAYIQAYYCLEMRNHSLFSALRGGKRRSVLITNGETPLGQAVISLSLNLDCTVFTTVSNVMKKKFLLKNFRELEESHIGFNNDLTFRQAVMNATKKNRCDIVINSDIGQKRLDAMELVAFLRIFLDVSDRDMKENVGFPMGFVNEERSYICVQLSNIFLPENSGESKKLQRMLSKGISDGAVKPLTRVVYSTEEISRALKLLSTANNVGSVLINMKDAPILKEDTKVVERIELSSSKAYIVVCDGTALGVELIEHLIVRGAKRFLIHMKPKQLNGYFHVKYASWKNNDVIINFNANDLYSTLGCESLVKESEQLGDLDGIFIVKNVLEEASDKIEENNMDVSLVSANLDVASRSYTLSHFTIILTLQKNNKYDFSDIEKRCNAKSDNGLPSLFLRYESDNQILLPQEFSKIYNSMEISSSKKYVNVYISSDRRITTLPSHKPNVTDGLGAFVKKICEDEYTAVDPAILMKTQLSYEDENELYIDPDEPHVLMIPGFDGNYQNLDSISERLKIKAITLQLEADATESITDIAKRLLAIARKIIHLNSKFYILGYSFGVSVALEIAALLEKEGHTGVVYCLDSSPTVLKKQLNAYIGDLTDQKLQDSVIEHFFNILTGKTCEKFSEEFTQMEWSTKIEILIENVKGSVTYTHQFMRGLVNAVYKRIVMAKEYEPNLKLNSELVLMKGVPHPRSDKLSDDYDLSEFSTQQVKVFNLEADHASACEDIRVSNIVNKMLDPKLLEEFKNRNLCQYYF